jgi:hypothetical protein
MADFTVNTPRSRSAHSASNRSWEYQLYFWTIFALALLTGVLTWSYRLASTGKLPRLGPVGRALADAHALAPIIFRS